MNYWIFTVKQRDSEGVLYESAEILKHRLEQKFWGLGERTPNRRALKKGDRAVFYLGKPEMNFGATCVLASDSFKLSQSHKEEYSGGVKLYQSDYGVKFDKIELLEPPRIAKDLIPSLTFIENKENWGSYFQGGVRQLSQDDFHAIISGGKILVAGVPQTAEEVTSQSQFALEAHLEEFILNFRPKFVHFQMK